MERKKKSRKKRVLIKNALDENALKNAIDNLTNEEVAKVIHDLSDFIYLWDNPTIDRIKEMIDYFPFINKVIDFKIIFSRFKRLDEFDDKGFGVQISEFIPELNNIYSCFVDKFHNVHNGIEKAELWLQPIAENAWASADVEAAVYFASRNKKEVIGINTLKDSWHRSICSDIERGNTFGKINKEVKERAKSKVISLAEASEVLKFNDSLPRFFAFRDEEEDFIDAAFFRAVEWFDITGFKPWLDSLAHETSISVTYGVEHIQTSWWMFYWCRSDLAINKTERTALETLLWTLMLGPIERLKPWRQSWTRNRQTIYTNYIPIVGILPFIWHRINHGDLDYEIIKKSLELLFQTQMITGGWPLTTSDSEPSIMSTCFAIHGLAMAQPKGWKQVCKKASKWLMTQQKKGGYWHINGGPAVMITVLVLDSINLANDSNIITFRRNSKINLMQEVVSPFEEPKYNFDLEEYYNQIPPDTTSKSFSEISNVVKPAVGLVVATEVELKQALRVIKPLPRRKKIIKVMNSNLTYYIGKLGAFDIVLMLSGMGSEGPTGSTIAVDRLIREWNPTVVLLVGTAFGADKRKHLPADVLIAENIIPYEQQRVGAKTTFRNPVPPTSPSLMNRFRNTLDWNFLRPDKSKCKIHFGPVLSGTKLVDNQDFKRELLDQYPHAIGGEMEGAGLWSSASSTKKEWIIVKAVCDWGDGKKHKEYQQMAAAAAMSLCRHVLNDSHFLDGIK